MARSPGWRWLTTIRRRLAAFPRSRTCAPGRSTDKLGRDLLDQIVGIGEVVVCVCPTEPLEGSNIGLLYTAALVKCDAEVEHGALASRLRDVLARDCLAIAANSLNGVAPHAGAFVVPESDFD